MKIDIWADIICPYCYIGKRNLSMAIKELDLDKDVEIIYHSFELNPKAENEGKGDTIKYLMDKYNISNDQAEEMINRIVRMGKASGLELKFHKEQETVEALFKANFIDFLNVGDIEVLADIGAEVGFNRNDVLNMLNTDEFFSEVNNDEYKAVEYNINSVPYYIINDKYAVSGAQPTKVFLEVFKKVNKDKNS